MLLHYDAVKQNIFLCYIRNVCRQSCIFTLPRQLLCMNLGVPRDKWLFTCSSHRLIKSFSESMKKTYWALFIMPMFAISYKDVPPFLRFSCRGWGAGKARDFGTVSLKSLVSMKNGRRDESSIPTVPKATRGTDSQSQTQIKQALCSLQQEPNSHFKCDCLCWGKSLQISY